MKNDYWIGVCKKKPKLLGTLLIPVGVVTTMIGWLISISSERWISPAKLEELCAENDENDKGSDSEK